MGMTKLLGVDLSEYQRGISFARLISDGAQFVILRGGDGGYNDKCFGNFYDQAKTHGLPVGAYWFSRALNANQAEQEAMQFYSSCLKGRQFELPVYMDIECKAQQNLSKAALTDVVKVWTGTLRKLGYMVGVYTTAYWLNNEVDRAALGDVELWVAQWSSSQPTVPHGMWQFGGETNLLRSKYMAGQVVDQNYMYKDYPAIIKAAGQNGFVNKKEEEIMRYKTFFDIPDWAKPEIKELMDAGALRGNENGDLNLTDDMMRSIIISKRYADIFGYSKQ